MFNESTLTLMPSCFNTLIASGAGAAGASMPILCNGANLAFTKEAWMQSRLDLVDEQMSGDDIFLLQSIKKRGLFVGILNGLHQLSNCGGNIVQDYPTYKITALGKINNAIE